MSVLRMNEFYVAKKCIYQSDSIVLSSTNEHSTNIQSDVCHHKIQPSIGMFLKGEFLPKINPSPPSIPEPGRRK